MELQELKETRFLADFHQSVDKAMQKNWHDRHIKTKVFVQGDKVLLYDSRYQKHPGKLWMHWLVLHIIFVIPMTVNDVNLSVAFRGVSGLSS
jgi:hypothetical protein